MLPIHYAHLLVSHIVCMNCARSETRVPHRGQEWETEWQAEPVKPSILWLWRGVNKQVNLGFFNWCNFMNYNYFLVSEGALQSGVWGSRIEDQSLVDSESVSYRHVTNWRKGLNPWPLMWGDPAALLSTLPSKYSIVLLEWRVTLTQLKVVLSDKLPIPCFYPNECGLFQDDTALIHWAYWVTKWFD